MEQARFLAERFPGSRLRANAFGGETMVFEVDGCWLDARLLERASLEVFIRTLDAPGVQITIEARDRTLAISRHDPDSYDRLPSAEEIAAGIRAIEAERSLAALSIRKNDDPIAALWIDPPAEAALVAGMFGIEGDGGFRHHVRLESFRYVVENGEVWIDRRARDPEHLYRAFVAAATLAARPHRLARAWLDVARGLGGTTTADRWDLADRAGEFAVTIDRSPAAVRIDNLRRLPGEDDDHAGLYTRARARRIAADGDRWAMWRPALARVQRPHAGRGLHPAAIAGWDALATDPARLVARVRAQAALLDAAAPSALATIDDTVELWWPGLVQDPARLGPAVELLARLAAELDASAGPYR